MKRYSKPLLLLTIAFTLVFASVAHAGKAPPTPTKTISVTVSTDKATYAPGETVKVTAIAKYSDGTFVSSYRTKSITIKNPAGTTVVSAAAMTAGATGTGLLTYNYVTPSTAAIGEWSITVNVSDSARISAVGSSSFSIGSVGPHAGLLWSGYPANCRSCHSTQATDMYKALHYQWQSAAPDNLNKTGTMQGKMTNAMNAYCINILGNWGGCGKCHVGRGAQPVLTNNPTLAQLDNIDCLVCHSDAYALARVRLADGSMGPAAGTAQATLDGYVRNITRPTRVACLKCHAYAGGGDAVKRGDISATQVNTSDANHDVHMATSRGNFSCQRCHKFVNHKVTGKGSDLESTDHASEIKCATSECHPTRVSGGHTTAKVNDHIAHVACQTCHIPVYGKVATEMERDWRTPQHAGQPSHPSQVKQSNVTPAYRWWNRKTSNYLKGDAAVYDATTGTYHMDVLQGSVTGDTTNKIYPFKYKTSYQPIRSLQSILIALDTNQYLNINGDYNTSVSNGLVNMGFLGTDAWTTVKTDTYQLLNHTIADAQATGGVMACSDCHESTIGGAGTKMNLKTMGYAKKADYSVLCVQCHAMKTWKGYTHHGRHVDSVGADCSWCHNFSRPERGLMMP